MARPSRAGERSDWRLRRPSAAAAAPSSTSLPRPVAVDTTRYELGNRKQWMVVKNFVNSEERLALFRKAIIHMQRGELFPNPSGPHRYFAKADDQPDIYVDSLLESMTRRCERCLRMNGVRTDCVLGRTISLILPGGFIHRHTDKYMEGAPGHRPGLEHMRCNIVVRLTEPSGRPIVEGVPLPVAECDLWAFYASKCPHETAPITGTEPRIVFGFGWSVPPSHQLEPPPEGWDRE